MFAPRLLRATSTVLAVLLLAGTVAPPAVRHKHAFAEGGDLHHQHHADHQRPHSHEHHGDESRHPLAELCLGEADIMSGDWWHLHLQFLGFAFTLPEPTSNENDRETRGNEALSVLASDEEPLPRQTTVASSIQQIILSSIHCSTDDAAPMQVVLSAPAPISFTPLCDRARRERSGVLIA